LISVVVILGVWELIVRAFHIAVFLLPAPSLIFESIGREWFGRIQGATLTTAEETVIGFGVAIAVGVPIAVLMTYSKVADRFLYPLLVSSQVVPKVAIAPLFVIWFGFGLPPKILIAFLISFFPIVISTTTGLRSIDRSMLYLARSMGGGLYKTLWKVRLPNALPGMFAGLKVGITLAVVGAVVGEFVGSSAGLGHVLITAMGNLDTPTAFASIIMMSVVGIILYALVEVAERVLMPWRKAEDDSGAALLGAG
jgi:NitT/TauT family transport system permease protein